MKCLQSKQASKHSGSCCSKSLVSFTSSLVVKMLTALVSTIKVFLLKKKCEYLLQFSATILAYMPYFMIKVLTIC